MTSCLSCSTLSSVFYLRLYAVPNRCNGNWQTCQKIFTFSRHHLIHLLYFFYFIFYVCRHLYNKLWISSSSWSGFVVIRSWVENFKQRVESTKYKLVCRVNFIFCIIIFFCKPSSFLFFFLDFTMCVHEFFSSTSSSMCSLWPHCTQNIWHAHFATRPKSADRHFHHHFDKPTWVLKKKIILILPFTEVWKLYARQFSYILRPLF